MNFKKPDQLSFIKLKKVEQKSSDVTLEKSVVLITGATSGIGLETANLFASRRATLLLLVRDKLKGETLKESLIKKFNIECRVYIANFENLSDLKLTLDEVLHKETRIDILINNAGCYRTKKKILDSGIDSVFTVNHLAPLLITDQLIPLLEKGDIKRVVNVNSEGHRFGSVDMDDLNWKRRIYTGLRSYGASKTAQLHTMYIISRKLKDFNITINSMHPGAVKSNIGSHSGKIYNFYMKYFLSKILKDPSISASAIFYIGTSSDLKDTTAVFFNLTIEEIPAPHAQESDISENIYKKSMELIYDRV